MLRAFIFFLTFCISTPLLAKIYKCTNEKGQVFYHDNLKKLAKSCPNDPEIIKTRKPVKKENCFGDSEKILQLSPNQNITPEFEGDKATVRLLQDRRGHYVVPGKINGLNVTFLVDTGATNISVPSNVARCLGLEPGQRMTTTTANGKLTTYATLLDSVSVGSIKLNQVQGNINSGLKEGYILLGMSFLKKLEIIQKENQLILQHTISE